MSSARGPVPGGGSNSAAGDNPLAPDSFAAVSCAAEVAARRIARRLTQALTGPLEVKGLMAVVTASEVGAAVLAAVRQLGNLQFPVSGIVLGSIEFAGGVFGDEIKRCRQFRIPLRECQNEQDLQFVLQFAGLRLVAVDLREEVTRHSELRDGLLDHACVDLWSLPAAPVSAGAAEADGAPLPWYRQVPVAGKPADPDFQPLLTVSDLSRIAAPDAAPERPVAAAVAEFVAAEWGPLNRYFALAPVTRETARLLDSRAIREFNLSGQRMMELAAFQAAEIAALMARPRLTSPDQRVAVICGRGNNGGDGFVLARYLASWGFPVEVFIVGDREKIFEDALLNLRRLDRLTETIRASGAGDQPPVEAALQGEPLGDLLTPGWRERRRTTQFQPLPGIRPDLDLVELSTPEHLAANAETLSHAVLIVDGLLGTGMVGEVRGFSRAVIDWINTARVARFEQAGSADAAPTGEPLPAVRPHVPVLALDSPSGIDASTGAVLGVAVPADVTVTFGAPKIGLLPTAPQATGAAYAGQVVLAEIGWPRAREVR